MLEDQKGKLEDKLKDILQEKDTSQKGRMEDRLKELLENYRSGEESKASLTYQPIFREAGNEEIERLKKSNEELRKKIEKAKKDREETEIRIKQLGKSAESGNDEIEGLTKYRKEIQIEIEKSRKAKEIAEKKLEKLRKEAEERDKIYDKRNKLHEWLYSDKNVYYLYGKVGFLRGTVQPLIDYINSETGKKIRKNHVHFDKSKKRRNWKLSNEATFRELRLEAECAEKNIAKLKKSKYAQEYFSDFIIKLDKEKDELKSKTERLYSQYQEKLKQLS